MTTQTNSATAAPQYVYQNAIPDLLNWSIPWIMALSGIALLIAVGSLAVSYQDLSLADRLHGSIWQFGKAIAFFNLSILTFRLSTAAKNYVKTEQEKELAPFVVLLGCFWMSLSLALVATIANGFSKMANGIFLKIDPGSPISLVGFVILALGLTATHVALLLREKRMNYAQGKVLKHLHPMAANHLARLRFASVLAIAGGLALLFFGAADTMYSVSDYGNQAIAAGFVVTAIGAALQFYRRSVRDVHRNAVPTFFERALNRLNFFWLLFTVAMGLLFISAFF